jgi:hypothetical protein
MFDGTDLSSAYGSSLLEPQSMPTPPSVQMSSDPVPPIPPSHAPQQAQQAQLIAPGAASHATPPAVSYNPPAVMYATEPEMRSHRFQESFWDKLASKKWDVVKLVILSLVVLLAMSVDRVGNFYLLKYVDSSLLSPTQEFLVRLSYPVIVLLLLWIIKAMS